MDIKLNLPAKPFSGQIVTFVAPCDCIDVAYGLYIYDELYTVCDASGKQLTGVGNVWSKGSYVSVILDCTAKKAYIQNAAAAVVGTVSDIDLSNLENGSFTEVVDGKVVEHTAEFDENGKLIKIDDITVELGDVPPAEEYAPIDHNHDGKYTFGQEFEFDSGDINATEFTYAGNKAHMYNILLVPGEAYLGGYPVTIDWGFLPNGSGGEYGNFWVHTGDDLVNIKAWKDNKGQPHFEAPSGFLFRRIRGYY